MNNGNNEYAKEAKARWGHTEAYKESTRRTSNYSKEDFAKAAADQERAIDLFITAMDANLDINSEQVKLAVVAHRKAISDWFYECSEEMQVGLAEMYIADPRFTEFYESRRTGLAQFVHDGILASAKA